MISAIGNSYSDKNINPVSFQAKLITEIPIKDAKKLLNVQKIFEDKSQNYKYGRLTIGKSLDKDFKDYVTVRSTDEIACCDYKYSHIIENFDEMFEKLSENEIAKKLLSYFKTMKKEEKFDNIAHRYNSRIDRVENAKRHNLSLAAYFRNRGKADYAAQYETIAASNQAKIDKLKAQKTAELNKIADDMEKSISNNNEMCHIPDAYLDIEQIPRI